MITPLSTKNEAKIPLHLVEEIRNQSAVLFVGSGLSISLGYPSWENLISDIYERIESTLSNKDEKNREWLQNNFANQPDWVAEVINEASHDEYNNALKSLFRDAEKRKISINHILISLLSFKGYLTTNYDTLIEDYLKIFDLRNPQVFSYSDAINSYFDFKKARRYVLKLHGCAKKDISKIILNSSEYYQLLHDDRYIRLLASIFSESTILCVGFSLKDRDFKFFLEERYHLYEKRCPPLYAVISDESTCPLEIDILRKKYNVHILTISSQNNYSELTSFLYSLYCIVHREDSMAVGSNFINTAILRVQDTGRDSDFTIAENSEYIQNAKTILSIFKEPIEIDAFIAICMDSNIKISVADCLAMADRAENNKIFLKQPIQNIENKYCKYVAKWVSSELESIPVTDSPRHFTSHHKAIFSRYVKTLSFILKNEECWNILIGGKKKGKYKLIRITQFFKQDGLWKDWLDIALQAKSYVLVGTEIEKELLQSILWIYFWTRRYDEAKKLLGKHPELDEKNGEDSYADRLAYMNKEGTDNLIAELESRPLLDYFAVSLLGRLYARLYLLTNRTEKKHISKAKKYLLKALSDAEKKGDWIERSVRSWYLSIVLSDLGEVSEARNYLAEVRRLDESIMNRVPGLAWLDLAEYRMAKNDSEVSDFCAKELRKKAILSYEKLGTIFIEQYIDHEYYY